MISVCMATHNGERFIAEQLKSILMQLAVDDEVVISDDSSTDRTVDIIRSFADSRIRLYENNTYFSPIFNFENAIKKASGNVIVLADQDDIWFENKIPLIRERFSASTETPYLIVLDACVIDDDGNITDHSLLQKYNAGPGVLKNLFDNTYIGCCMAFSRDLLDIALPFPKRIPMHDMWLGQLCDLVGKTEFVRVPTMKYRKHAGSLTDFSIRLMPWTQIKRRWFLAWYLLVRLWQTRRLHIAH